MSGEHSRFGYSAVSDFETCPYKYRLRHIDRVETLPDYAADNPLTIGTAFHLGMERGLGAALEWYAGQFPVIGEAHEHEMMKLQALVPRVRETLSPDATHETVVRCGDFVGTIDYLEPTGDGTWDMLDFKYCSLKNVPRYEESPQLHIYRHYLEQSTDCRVRKMGYLCVPKVQIRQRRTEDLHQFRERLRRELAAVEPRLVRVDYDARKVEAFQRSVEEIRGAKEFPKRQSPLCRWCEYRGLCERGDTTMILPSNERRNVEQVTRRKMWIYGASFSGKTTMLDGAPNPLNLNTDGNVQFVTMPYVAIKDEVTVEGRMTKRKDAWTVFKEAIEELEKGQNGFDTIIIDLVEDTREMCRIHMYEKLGIQHESDAGYGKGWDIIKTEYLSTMRRFFNLDYQNLVIVSHEAVSEVKMKSGQSVTKIAPNLQEGVALKLAGMVDIVARVHVEEDGERILSFRPNEYVFGGGRFGSIGNESIPLSWDALCEVYDIAARGVKHETPHEEPMPEPIPTPEPTDTAPQAEEAPAPKRRVRKRRAEE